MINARVLGRYVPADNIYWLSSPGSEVGFSFSRCSRGELVLYGDGSVLRPECAQARPRCAVYLNGVPVLEGVLDKPETRLRLPLGENAAGTVRVIKLSEASQSHLGVRPEGFDGETRPLPEKKKKIEFIGDSITCGYGVDGAADQVFSTLTEDVRRGWAWQTAEALDADACYTAFSGFGIVSGYTGTGEKNAELLVPDFYERVGFCDREVPGQGRISDMDWDFSLFRPRTVVINLGTNDASYCGSDPLRQEEFRRGYTAFLKTVRRRNPDARIVCVLGLMGTVLNESAAAAVADYTAETGDGRVSFHPLREQLAEDGYGTDFHPSALTHKKTALWAAELLRRECGL